MPNTIEFPDGEPKYDSERDCLAFLARVDGKPVECFVTGELLMTRFGAEDITEDALHQAFEAHREEIEALARSHIENGWIDEEGRLFLTRYFTQLTVTFPSKAASLPRVERAHQVFREIIGPYAGTIEVRWDTEGTPSSEPTISLQILDPSDGYQGKFYLKPNVENDPIHLRFTLAQTWALVLRKRSENLMLKSG